MARDQGRKREKKKIFLKMIKAKASGLTMTREIGALYTKTLDVLLILTEKAVMTDNYAMWVYYLLLYEDA